MTLHHIQLDNTIVTFNKYKEKNQKNQTIIISCLILSTMKLMANFNLSTTLPNMRPIRLEIMKSHPKE